MTSISSFLDLESVLFLSLLDTLHLLAPTCFPLPPQTQLFYNSFQLLLFNSLLQRFSLEDQVPVIPYATDYTHFNELRCDDYNSIISFKFLKES